MTPDSPGSRRRELLPTSFRLLILTAAFVVIIAGLQAAQSICVPFLVALFVAMIFRPLVMGLMRRKVPRGLAVAITLLVVAAVLAALGYVLSLSLTRVTLRMPQYQEQFQQQVTAGVDWLDARGIDATAWVSPESIGPGPLMDLVSGTFRGVANLLTTSFLVLLMTTFLLFEAHGFEEKLRKALGDRQEVMDRYARISEEVQRYLLIKTLVSLATGVSVWLWVSVLGLDFPLLWGFLAFILNYIPNIGSILAAIPAVILAAIQLGWSWAFLLLLGYALINVVWGNLLEPQILGRRLRLSPLAVFLSLVFWGWVWGPLGMLLSVPLTMVLKIAMENSRGFRWLAALLDPPPRPVAESGDTGKSAGADG